MYSPIEILDVKKVEKENKDLFVKLTSMSFSDLEILKKINSKKFKYIKKELEFKVFNNSLDEIDKIEIEKFRNKLRIQLVLINEAIERKFLDYIQK